MDQNTLVNKLRNLSNEIIKDHNSISLIMLLGNNFPESTTAFDYVISAKWLNDYNLDEGMDLILDYLYKRLSVEDLEQISRVTIIHTSDPIVQNITRNMGVQGAISFIMNCQFGNIIIPNAVIFESRFEK